MHDGHTQTNLNAINLEVVIDTEVFALHNYWIYIFGACAVLY